MLAALLVPALLSRQTFQTIELENGTALDTNGKPSPHNIYWSCADTYLDLTDPNQNFGDSAVLEGGPGRAILIKFGDLEGFRGRKVVKATLFLTASEGGKAAMTSIKRVLGPWGEGPLRRPFFTNKPDIAAQWSATWNKRRADPDGIAWQQSGAAGPSVVEPIVGAKAQDTPTGVAITGIEPAVQQMVDRWYDNNGFAISFAAPIEFFSSKNNGGKPRLELELGDETPTSGPDLSVTLIEAKYAEPTTAENPWPKDGTPVTYIAHVQNVGKAPSKGFSAAWNVREKLGSAFDVAQSLTPGQETTIELKRTFKTNSTDHRLQPLGLRIMPKGDDANPSNDYLEIQEDAIPVMEAATSDGPDGSQQKIRRLNDVILPESRFSFAPEGCVERFRISDFARDAKASTVKDILSTWSKAAYDAMQPSITKLEGKDLARDSRDRWPGRLGGGFTPNEIGVPGEIQLPYEPYYDPVFDNFELAPTWLLAASEVASLDSNLNVPLDRRTFLKLPPTVIFRVLNLDGDPLGNADLSFYQTKDGRIPDAPPVLKLTTGDNGTVLLPARSGANGKKDPFGGLLPDGSNGVYLVACTFNGVTDYRWLKAWQLSDSYARTGKAALFNELRFNVPADEVDSAANLAAAKPVSDSDKSSKLGGLVDGDVQTAVELPNKKGSWIEIDLGKDQEITEVDLIGKDPHFWQRFDVLTYFTGQTAKDARPFGHEVDWAWNLETRHDLLDTGVFSMPYRGSGKGVRYVRITCNEPGASASLSEIRVLGAKTSSAQGT